MAGRTTSYTYGAGGRMVTMVDAQGFVRTCRYDVAGRTVREEYVCTGSAFAAEGLHNL